MFWTERVGNCFFFFINCLTNKYDELMVVACLFRVEIECFFVVDIIVWTVHQRLEKNLFPEWPEYALAKAFTRLGFE